MDKFDLLKDIFSALEIKIDSRSDISNLILRQDTLRCKNLIHQLNEKVPNLKTFYNSSKLTCLHKNSLNKQKFPAVNMFRQILKCNCFKMEPYVISKGYDKSSGKKLVERYYRIRDLNLCDENEDNKIIDSEENKEEILVTSQPQPQPQPTNSNLKQEILIEINEENNGDIINIYNQENNEEINNFNIITSSDNKILSVE